MPQTQSTDFASYGLSTSSRRRRMLVARAAAARIETEASPHLQPAVALVTEDDAGPTVFEGEAPPNPKRTSAFQPIHALLKEGRPLTWVFAGDSITHGAQHTDGRRSFSEHFAERTRWEMRRFSDVVINTGVSGGTATGLLQNLKLRCTRFQPEVVFVMVGTNDAKDGPAGRRRFFHAIQTIAKRIDDSGSLLILQTPSRIDLHRSTERTDLPVYVKLIRRVARELNVPLIDHWDFWETAEANGVDLGTWLAEDGIHPGACGHRAIAKLLFKRLDIFDPHSPTCNAKLT